MRLLELKSNGQVSLTKDLINNIPPYAILSHTWGDENDEVTFEVLTGGSGKTRRGYDKIEFCAAQARIDGLQHIWIDTCCIDKSNNTEFSEAIISMFRWYRNAVKCYVYLADVTTAGKDPAAQLWSLDFRKSKWFTRGWTLQELIAPSTVEFFSVEGHLLGSKHQLEQQIHEITGIAIKALQGHALSGFNVAERLSWAEIRETKREEDKAYSLLGIFNVNMLPMYGEGMESAFQRLHKEIGKRSSSIHNINLLTRLPYAIEAPFNAYQRQHDPSCLPNTRVDLLRYIYNWADGQDGRSIFWLNGLAGTGKSTIARTVARRYFDQKRLGASFFFSRGGGDVGHAGKFVTSIAVQLAGSIPSLEQHICDAFAERRDIASQSLRDQWQQLIQRPLSKLGEISGQHSYILVVDALDECNIDSNIRIILDLLAEAQSLTMVRLRVFLTSRPETPIRHGFGRMPDEGHQDFVLHNISPSVVDHDISIFLEHNLKLIGEEHYLDACWADEEIIRRLTQIAGGLFIWAATSCRFISEGKRFAARRLDTILQSNSSTPTAPEKHLDEIYMTVLKQSVAPEYTDEEKKEAYEMLRTTLGSIVILLSPLSAPALSRLVNIRKEVVNQTLNDVHSVLDVPKDQSQPLRLHHPSFRDYLLNNRRCRDQDLWVNEKHAHQILANCCIRLLSKSLKQDICGVGDPGTFIADVESVEQNLSLEVQYACRYWIQHVEKSDSELCDYDQVHLFLQKHLLHWLEALGWTGKVAEGIHAIASLESFAASSDCPMLLSFIHDAKRFVLYNRSAIEQAPLQVYSSALIFAPTTSIIRESFKCCIPGWIPMLPKVEEKWNAALQTLEGHLATVTAVAFSPDGRTLASASYDETVKVWDAGSGALLQTLEGHSNYINSVAFSPDGRTLASASYDKTVMVWDIGLGSLLQRLEGHSNSVNAVAFLPDGRTLASGSGDKTIKLWDTRSGVLLQALLGHSDSVTAVIFSLDGKTLASASSDKTVKVWDTGSGVLMQSLKGHFNSVTSVAFSPDSRTLVSASWDKMVKVWNTRSGVLLQTLRGHSGSVSAVAFSPDGKTLASASSDKTVKVWETRSGTLLQTLKGHSDSLTAVAFSPGSRTLASASRDMTVKVWDVGSDALLLQMLESHSNSVTAVTFSPDGKTLASASRDMTVKVWDTGSGVLIQSLKGHSNYVNAIAFLPDGKALASASYDKTVKIWDTGSGAVLQTLEGHLNYVNIVASSPDSRTLASASWDMTVKLWDTGSGALLQTIEGHSNYINAVAFSPDSRKLASASWDMTVKVWDAESGALLQTLKLEGNSNYVSAVAFSPDGRTLASALQDGTVKMWDAVSGALLQTVDVDSIAYTLSFSEDGTSLHTDRGSLPVSFPVSTGLAVRPHQPSLAVFVKDQWICSHTDPILWLPPEYRPDYIAVHGSTIGFGYASGRVMIMKLAV